MPQRPSNPKAAIPKALSNIRGANKDAQGRYLADVARRERAANILNPNEVSGEYDAGRMLMTTFGGELRALTPDDLRAFRENVKRVGRKYKGGITPKTVIDMSLAEDRERANKQIRFATPAQFMGGRVHFITDAGPDSDVTRHHVHIQLLNFSAAVSSPAKASELTRFIVNGPLKFDCDCGRHTYWYRYVATVGRYNAGRDETGFPKIKNPNLVGVACKHVLRVMQVLSSPSIRLVVEKMLDKARNEVARTAKHLTAEEIRELARRQIQEANWKRNLVESGAERASRLAQSRAAKALAERSRAVSKSASKASVDSAKRKFEAQAKKLASLGVITAKQLQAMMAKIKG
jgi:hypothetical protein